MYPYKCNFMVQPFNAQRLSSLWYSHTTEDSVGIKENTEYFNTLQ